MTAELNTEFLKLTLNDSKVNADLGNGVVLNTDTKTVKDALTSVAGVVGVENCMKIGGAAAAATALYVAARSLAVKWPWLKTTGVKEDNVLEVAFPSSKENAFKKILEKGQLERAIQDNFEDLDSNLEGILGEEVNDAVGERVLELIQDVRVSSVGTIVGDIPENMTALHVVQGKYNMESRNQHNLVAVDGTKKGVATMTYIGNDGDMTAKFFGGSNTIIAGDNSAITRALAAQERLNEDKIVVTVNFPEDLALQFQHKFQPTDKTGADPVWAARGGDFEVE